MSNAEGSLRDRIDDALLYVDAWGAGEAYYIVGEILDATYRALKRAPEFAHLCHDRFDALTADVREYVFQDLGQQVDGLCDLGDIKRIIDRELED